MGIELSIGGVIFDYPETSSEDWGEEATGWAEAVTEQINILSSIGDISPTVFVIPQVQANFTDITGLRFDNSFVKGAFVEYNIQRSSNTAGQKYAETGVLMLAFTSSDTSATGSITSISAAASAVVTSAAHGMSNGDQVIITGSNSTPSINGLHTISGVATNTFVVPVTTSGSGSAGTFTKTRWELTRYNGGSSGPTDGVTFIVKDNGQVQYTADSLDASGYQGKLRFRARVIRDPS